MAQREQLKDKSIFLAFARYQKATGHQVTLKGLKAATGLAQTTAWANFGAAKKQVEAEEQEDGVAVSTPSPEKQKTEPKKSTAGRKRKAENGDASEANGKPNASPKKAKKGKKVTDTIGANADEPVVKSDPDGEQEDAV